MKKCLMDLKITQVNRLHERYVMLKATPCEGTLPAMLPGQFAQLRVDNSPTTFLRRPISIHDVCTEKNEVSFLIQIVGEGTSHLSKLAEGDVLNVLLPLGKGFSMPTNHDDKYLLIGGGVGIAPLLYMGRRMVEQGMTPTFLLGARTASDLLRLEEYQSLGTVYVTTEDGSMGEKGFVTQHSILQATRFEQLCVCGPKPMMMAVAKYAKTTDTACEVSLENTMACGIGACLCCVEDTQKGHLCVCKEGPVFNINDLKWPI